LLQKRKQQGVMITKTGRLEFQEVWIGWNSVTALTFKYSSFCSSN
jgi:hypothetical protein